MYQVIARKYRPQSFDDLVGQEHIKRTLSNAIEQRRIAHGYIFSGQRGTGKTTVARIMARCLNCIEGPTMVPCGKCASCLEVTAGNSVDVIEIDAASNRGINEMRELRESVRFRPARDRYKVFIIDEAHQITNDAFNALLKTLEEPPEWVVFMLCTTESHKLPATITSRCQHFSFRSVEMEELVTRMQRICGEENIEADIDALTVIAQAGGGSVRDSLSALDQAIACCGNTLNAEQVRLLMGSYSLDMLQRVTEALSANDGHAMLQVVDELERTGQNLQHFCREITAYFRNLLVARVAGPNGRLISGTKPELERIASISQQFSERDLTRYLNMSLELFAQLQHSLQPRFHVELGLLRLIEAGRIATVEQAISALRRIDDGGPEGPGGGDGSSSNPPSGAARPSAPSASAQLGSTTSASGASTVSNPTANNAQASVSASGSGLASAYAVAASAAAVAPKKLRDLPSQPVSAPSLKAPESKSSSHAADERELRQPAGTPLPRLSVVPGFKVEVPVEPEPFEEAPSTSPSSPGTETTGADSPSDSADALRERLLAALIEAGKRFSVEALEQADLALNPLPNGALELLVRAPKETSLSLKEADLKDALRTEQPPIQRIRLEFGKVSTPPPVRRARSSADEEALRKSIETDPEIQRIQAMFHGTITRVRSLRE